MIKIKDIVSGGNIAFFSKYRQQHVYYTVEYNKEFYSFPIPLEDVQDATLSTKEKAITLMRYIRKALDNKTFIKVVE